ncbi:hypothetical protein [Sulfurimonas sp. RIFOXYB12_FULL_35_9]|uniref:hypothetical protein n=1 Tax=Sulfurimonas sp. RIFOXYB12_FULL_35_9 TaxID=1802256 RepID=UPI0008B3A5E8|nr:hypothetical protein [Sulfurimonas sp. RIFOXYB12_FULL_35_9]OHE03183.1 MAG: hypothetical protein A2345_04635 [Sulfurimonas sp. RIFOXYB12_FULL_35_9]OHE18243.1 MAG: hypothetical protein A2540_10415 [Sulfurimonas sp. RIFOXYD2_FULL_37_8]
MIVINSSDFIKKPSYITQPLDITFVQDAKKHITKSVVLPFELYEKVKEKIEDELYLIQNKKALSQVSYDDFLQIETVVEDL